MTAQSLPPGIELADHTVSGLLGAGGSGFTYSAVSSTDGDSVVIKEYFPQATCFRDVDLGANVRDESFSPAYAAGFTRFVQQMRAFAALRHPHLVRVTRVFEQHRTAYALMPHEAGRTLDEAAGAGDLAAEAALLDAIDGFLSGLHAVHQTGWLHQDLKLENLRLRTAGGVVLVDPGSLRLDGVAAGHSVTVPSTHAYAPIEQFLVEERRQGPWSDIFSLAVALYAVVTGRLPPDAIARWSELLRRRRDPVVPAVTLGEGRYSGELLAAIDRGMALRVQDRPRSVEEWRRMFPAVVAHKGAGLEFGTRSVAAIDTDGGRAARSAVTAPVEPTPAHEPHPVPVEVAGYADLTVLVVDDEQFMRSLLTRMLRRLGVQTILTADSGRRALEVLRHESGRVDLILADLVMDDIDGIEFIRALGADGHGADLVLVSGVEARLLRFASDLACSYALNVLGWLQKPPALDALRGLIDERFETPRAVQAVPPGSSPALTPEEFEAGLAGGALMAHYQPQVCVRDFKPVCVEALARWVHPRRGTLGPSAFIPLAELCGAIDRVTRAMLATALADCGRWSASGLHLDVSVNVAADCLLNPDLPELVEDLAMQAGVPASRVTLEITESQVVRDMAAELDTLIRLRLKGIKLSVDDFGTGHSSLRQLSKLPFTELKIDRGFVTGAARSADLRAILDASAVMARKLNLQIVAEGVETAQDLAVVEAAGCDLIQGYHVARPMPEPALRRWLRDDAPWR